MTNTDKNVEIGLFLGGKLSESKERIYLWEDEVMYFAVQRDSLESRYRLKFDTDWNWLHKAFEKYRDLKMGENVQSEEDWQKYYDWVSGLNAIEKAIIHGTLSEAFEALYEGVFWFNNLNK